MDEPGPLERRERPPCGEASVAARASPPPSLSGFVDSALAVAFLLARSHRPVGNWTHRGLGQLSPPGPRLHALFASFVEAVVTEPLLRR